MKCEYKKVLIILGVVILILVNFLFFWLGYYFFENPILGDFEIQGIKEEEGKLLLDITPSNHAVKYVTTIMKEGKKLYETTSDSSKIYLEDLELDYESEVEIFVKAISKKGTEKNTNSYHYKSMDATFDKSENHKLSDRDLTLSILGFQKNENYKVELYYGKNKLYETDVEKSTISIPYPIVEGYSGRITAYLKKESGRVLSRFNFYLNTPIVGKVKILSPETDYTTRWDDVTINFEGGENANHFFINFYINDQLEYSEEMEVNQNQIKIPAEKFNQNTDYVLELEAVYEDYFEISEKQSVLVHIKGKETTSGVYTTHNPNHIKAGTKVKLKTITEGATIYYTTDGSDPEISGMVYKTPLEINQNMTVKAYAVSRNRYSTPVYTYQFNISDKTPVIYLSPSNQDENYGALHTGFTNEMNMMNKIADVVQRELTEKKITVYRNNPYGNINTWTNESNSVHADFHFAIHSNASKTRLARGPEMYVDTETSLSFSIASNIYENLWSIYEGNTNYEYHRGIRYARGSLGEASDTYLPCSSLLEVAFHDNTEDATWIANNVEKIGLSLASSIISYYN